MPHHIIAVETYGAQRVKRPSGERVSAHKIGYSTCGRDVLLALYGEQAQDVSSKRARYHYVHITGETAVHKGTLLLRVTDEQLATAEAITRAHLGRRSGCWRWVDAPGRTNNGWQAFPTRTRPVFEPAGVGSGPRYIPSGYRAATPGSDPDEHPTLQVERVQLDPDKSPWWWIGGETYPHRGALKAAGGRWSRKRKQWYFIAEQLPASVAALVTAVNGSSDETAKDARTDPPETTAGGLFRAGDRVQAATDFTGLGGVRIAPSTRGQVTECYPSAGDLGHSYTVDFESVGATWCFEGDLTAAPTPDPDPPAATATGTAKMATATQAVAEVPRFGLGQTVYTHASVKLDTTGTVLAVNSRGVVTGRFDIRETDRFASFGYRVDFGGILGQQVLFEAVLASEPLSPSERRIKREEPIMLVPGATADEMRRQHIARRQAITEGVDYDAPTPAVGSESLATDDEPGEPDTPTVRVTTPTPLPERLQTAVTAAREGGLPISPPPQTAKRTPIEQAYVGELTGAITGNVYCYGWSSYQDTLLYVNMGGPSTAVAAIRAKLSKGEIVNLVPWDAPAIELSAGETDGVVNTGMFTAYVSNISEARFTSAILVHEWLTAPRYGGQSVTGIFRTDEAQAVAKLIDHVRKLVKVPVFDAWSGFLYRAGQSAGLVRAARGGGGIDLLVVDLDREAWTRLITGGLANDAIALPPA